MTDLMIPVSAGELFDKLSILQIKSARMTDATKLDNVRAELAALDAVARTLPHDTRLADLRAQLLEINQQLWQIEDDIRDREVAGDFGETFIALARAVYITNDTRTQIKREINLHLGSALIEEKSYAGLP